MEEASKSGEVGMREEAVREKRAVNSPKNSRSTWVALKAEFNSGSYISLELLAKKHGILPSTLRSRMVREKWNDQQRALQHKVEQVIQERVLTLAEKQSDYLFRLSKRGEKYERIIDASMETLGSKDANGTPLLDPEAIDQYTRSENRIMELNRVAYKIAPLSQLDITSKGASLGDSFVSAIAKLRADSQAPKLNDSDVSKILDAGVE